MVVDTTRITPTPIRALEQVQFEVFLWRSMHATVVALPGIRAIWFLYRTSSCHCSAQLLNMDLLLFLRELPSASPQDVAKAGS